MSIIHPGKLAIQDPTVTLSNYDDGDRTRFLYNGNQFIKAKLSTSRPSYAYVGSITNAGLEYIGYTEYKDTNGNYVLVNDEKYIPEATGAPTATSANIIIVGFSSQISTSEVYFWTTSYIETDYIHAQYSYDGSTYFDISGESFSWRFDADIQQRPGESPPVGEYEYTISLGASYTFRYLKLTTRVSTSTTSSTSSGATIVNVLDTGDFQDSSVDYKQYLYGEFNFSGPVGAAKFKVPFIYTGKTSTTFTGMSFDWTNAIYIYTVSGSPPLTITSDNWDTLDSGATVFSADSFAYTVTEIEVIRNEGALLEVWDTDGSQAASKSLEYDYYFDIVYDKYYDTYITIRQNTAYDGTPEAGFLLGDTFNYSTSEFDTTRWSESSTDTGFQLNTTSGTVENRALESKGRTTTKYYIDGNFTADIEIGFNNFSGTSSRVFLGTIDSARDNEFVSIGYAGPFAPFFAGPGNWEAVQVLNTIDTTGGAAYFRGLRFNTTDIVDGSSSLSFVYNSSSDYWTVTSGVGGSLPNLTPGVSYSEGPIETVSIVHSSTPANGSTLDLKFNKQMLTAPSQDTWLWRLGIEKSGDNIVCRYDVGTGAFTDWITYISAASYDLNLELFSDTGSSSTGDLTLDNLVVSGTGYWADIPVLSVEALDENGNRVQVIGLTDTDGYVIKQFDILSIPSEYNSWGSGKIQFATDGLSSANSGSLFFKIGTDLYKYNKNLFPLVNEDGASATSHKTNVIPEIAEVNFAYNAYTNAGLYYIEKDADRDGVYIYTLSTSTISGTAYEVQLDLTVDTYPTAWDTNNYTTMYYVEGTSLKYFNVNAENVAFCNVAAIDKVMSAGSGDSTTVTATVLNPYGEPLESKTVAFSVSAGDGAVSPSTGCTTASGVSSATYTVGSTVGTSTLSATASDIAC
jgi:hypothetical protein